MSFLEFVMEMIVLLRLSLGSSFFSCFLVCFWYSCCCSRLLSNFEFRCRWCLFLMCSCLIFMLSIVVRWCRRL